MSDGLFGSFFGPIFGNNQRTDVTTVKTVHEIVQRDDAEITRLRAENEKLRTALKPFVTAPPSDAKPDDYDWLMVRPEDIRAAATALKETGHE